MHLAEQFIGDRYLFKAVQSVVISWFRRDTVYIQGSLLDKLIYVHEVVSNASVN